MNWRKMEIVKVGPFMDGTCWHASVRTGNGLFINARGTTVEDAFDKLMLMLGEDDESGSSAEIDGAVAGEPSRDDQPANGTK